MIKEAIEEFNCSALIIAKLFWDKYFKDDCELSFDEAFKDSTFFAIGDEYNGVWEIEQCHWYSLSEMIQAFELMATKDQIEEWSGKLIDGDKPQQSFKNFIKYGWISKND